LDWEAAVRSRFEASAFLVIGLVAFSVPLFAHHGNASYETKVITLKGTVTAWVWANPHVFLKVNVKDGQGKIVNWTAELVAPLQHDQLWLYAANIQARRWGHDGHDCRRQDGSAGREALRSHIAKRPDHEAQRRE
jgi:Family of unknown function (DUF6152)